MANTFFSGARPITASSSVDFNVTGLALNFDPVSVSVNVRQPSADADIITAYVVGTPTRDGFAVTFSSPIEVSGYLLDFTVFGDVSVAPVAGDTLALGYADLKGLVARFLGYNLASLTEAQTSEIDEIIQSGVRNFYYPPKMEGVDENFEWSFLRQLGGTIDVSAGVDAYELPDGFGRFAGQIAVNGEAGAMIPIIPYGDIVRFRTREEVGRPRFAAVVWGATFGGRGQRKQVHFYPKPDVAYTLSYVCDADSGKIDAETRPFPLGGVIYSELIKESCLAVAEQMSNDEEGLHTKKFNDLLVSSIARDRKASAQDFGDIGDPEAREGLSFHPLATRGFLV